MTAGELRMRSAGFVSRACVLYTLDGNIDLKFMKFHELFIWADNFNCFDSGRRQGALLQGLIPGFGWQPAQLSHT